MPIMSDNDKEATAPPEEVVLLENKGSPEKSTVPVNPVIRVYKERWLMLVVFVLCVMCSTMQLFQMLIISHVLVKYFPVSMEMIHMTGFLSTVNILVLFLPSLYVLNNYNLRKCIIVGMVITAAGSWMKVALVKPDWFMYIMVAHFIAMSGQGLLINCCARLAILWFPNNEVSTASCIAQSGSQIGIALGFFLPPLFVRASEDSSTIGHQFRIFLIVVAVLCTITLLFTIKFFKAEPAHPPSMSQALAALEEKQAGLMEVAKFVFSKPSNVLFLLVVGAADGHFIALNNLSGPMFNKYFPESAHLAGTACSMVVVFGIAGMLIAGIVLDKTKKYKLCIVSYTFLSVGAVSIWALTFEMQNIIGAFFGFAFIGLTESGMLAIAFEVLSEVTYPAPALLTSTYLGVVNFSFGVSFITVLSILAYKYPPIWTMGSLVGILLVAGILMLTTPMKQKRQEAQNRMQQKNHH